MEKKGSKVLSWKYLIYDFIRITGIPGYLWFRPKRVFVNDNARKHIKGGALIISNHAGFAEPIVIMMSIWYRRQFFICTKDFFEKKSRWIFKQFHCIPIDKENFGMDSFRNITDELKAGKVITMFPEGHVNTGEGMDSFKSGMILMSVMGDAPIIPVYVKRREHFYERSVIAIGEPVDIRGFYGIRPSMSQVEEAAQLLYEKEEELRKLVGGKI